MSQLPAKFGNVMAENQRTHWDRWISPEQFSESRPRRSALPTLWHRDTFAHIYYLLFFLFPFPGFSYNGIKKPQILFPLELSVAFPSPGWFLGSSLKILFPEVSHFFAFEPFGGKSAKHFKLKLPTRVKSYF